MRIRKRPSSGPQKQRLIQQLPATYKYVFSTGWLLKRAYEEHDKQQQSTGVLDARYSSRLPEERGLLLHGGLRQHKEQQAGNRYDGVPNTSLHCCRCEQKEKSSDLSRECKRPQQHPIGSEEVIGEEPRTPPPFCGEKPALARQRSEHELHPVVDEKCLGFCSCGKDEQRKQQAKKSRRKSIQDWVKGESSGSGRKRTRTRAVEQQQEAATGDEHGLRPSSRLRDTAESSERSSHDNCGPQLSRLNAGGGASLGGDSYLRELNKMDPLRRALHTVVSDAGIAGLTAREAADRISGRGLLSEADIPRSVKMAKVMRDSPYLLELTRDSKFVLWSTFLEESSRKASFFNAGVGGGGGGDNGDPSAAVAAKARRRKHTLNTAPSLPAGNPREEEHAASVGSQDDRHRAVNGVSFVKVHREDHARTGGGIVVRQEIGGGVFYNREASSGGNRIGSLDPAKQRIFSPSRPPAGNIQNEVDHREARDLIGKVLGKEVAPVVKRQFFDLNLAPQEQEEEM